jgi:hypothetical protein
MATRTLKRKVLIREYDYKKVAHDSLMDREYGVLYDRASFTPVTLDDIEKHQIIELLKGKTETLWRDLERPALSLYNVKDFLYDPRYYDWQVTFDEEGYLCVQARKNTPKSRIGWGIFEKDLTSRI